MQENRWGSGIRHVWQRYDRMMERQGFWIVLAVCVSVIALSALYTFHFRELWDAGEGDAAMEDEMASSQYAQTLLEAQQLVRSAQTPVPAPTVAVLSFSQPVTGFLDRDFSMREPQYFPSANYWRLHPGIDLQAEYGAIVMACADGRVASVETDAEKGLCVRIRHAMGYESVCAGLSDASYVRAGDPVYRGQTIGHVGNGVLAEADAQPHLHFEVWKGSTAVDPVELFLGVDK